MQQEQIKSYSLFLKGVYNVLVSALILVPLVGYLAGTDIEGLDVLNRGKEEMEKVLQSEY